MKDPDCIFCKIASGEIPSTAVLDRANVFAFRDVSPQAPTHILIVPKEHVRDASVLGEEHAGLLDEMVAAANELARAEAVDGSGYRLVLNVGPDAGQTVFHLHLHLMGGRPMAWPPG
ncbi:MAG: histidine triad nucleotide-binding protein [Actinomycetota bacterium]